MKVAIFSPFSPDKSGIADFCEELIFELQKHMSIELFSRMPIENKKVIEHFKIHNIQDFEDENIRKQFDNVIYHVGNNIIYHKEVVEMFLKYPGILELHDISLHHYLAEDTFVKKDYEKYVEIMRYCHGKDGEKTARRFLNGEIRAPWEDQSAKYTVNKHLIDKAEAVIVHSDMAKQIVKGIRPDVPVINIPLHTPDIYDDYIQYKERCKQELGIPKEKTVLGSFGYATVAKRIPQILEALGRYKEQVSDDFVYYIVGKVEHIEISKLAHEFKIEKNVIVTGFTKLEDFKKYMGACDICFNLRYPTQGESSASLHRMLGMGKPILVTAIGSFEEYPDDIVMKNSWGENEITDIVSNLKEALANPSELKSRGEGAYDYANENCNLEMHLNIKCF